VINFDMPRDMKTYVHRVGRTARAGKKGQSVSLVGERERKMMREIAKHSTTALQVRTVPPQAVVDQHQQLSALEKEVGSILKQEALEREIRKTEMAANKASNMLDYSDEIVNRPKRTWFQSEREKRSLQDAYTGSLGGGDRDAGADGCGKSKPSKTSRNKAPGKSSRDRNDARRQNELSLQKMSKRFSTGKKRAAGISPGMIVRTSDDGVGKQKKKKKKKKRDSAPKQEDFSGNYASREQEAARTKKGSGGTKKARHKKRG